MSTFTATNTSADAATYEYTIEHYYYTEHRRFEQSIDVYMPVKSSAQTQKIPVVLVMGSGWLGHKAYFYTMTNWWNSSAPKQLCGRLGHPCVSIRHSGGFLLGDKNRSVPFMSRGMSLLWIAAGAGAVLAAKERLDSNTAIGLSLLLFMAFMYIDGIGAAGIEDMVSDVSAALRYIDEHSNEWGLANAVVESKNNNKNNIPVVFGGYSSGAHVAATLLTDSPLSPLLSATSKRPRKLKNLTIRSVMYLSGVLDVSPESFVMDLLSRLVLGKPPSEVPSPLKALSLLDKKIGNNYLPPHIVIGCKREVFGWSILDSAFCASEYVETLRSLRLCSSSCESNGLVRLILLEKWTVNHWSILSSVALRNALRTVLTSLDESPTNEK